MYYRLYILLEQATHNNELDLGLARERSDCGQLGGRTFEYYSLNLHQLFKLEEERDAHNQAANTLEQLVTRMALSTATEESAISQIAYVKDSITSYRRQELVTLHIHKYV